MFPYSLMSTGTETGEGPAGRPPRLASQRILMRETPPLLLTFPCGRFLEDAPPQSTIWLSAIVSPPLTLPEIAPPMFSIIVPVDGASPGASERLAETLGSVIRGSHRACEVIVVGDVDGLSIRSEFAAEAGRIHWIHRPGIGTIEAIGAGLDRAQGELVSWLSAGNSYFDDTLQVVAEMAARQPNVGCFCGDVVIADGDGNAVAEFNIAACSGKRAKRHYRFCSAAMFYRRQAIDGMGGVDPKPDPKLRYWADYDLWIRLDRAGVRFKTIPGLLAIRRSSAHTPAGEPGGPRRRAFEHESF